MQLQWGEVSPWWDNSRLSKLLQLRQIKPIRKPPEMWAVFRLLFPSWDISCYCSYHFLWVSMELLGGAVTAGKGFWGNLTSLQAQGELCAVLLINSQDIFLAHKCREGGAAVITGSWLAKESVFCHWLCSARQEWNCVVKWWMNFSPRRCLPPQDKQRKQVNSILGLTESWWNSEQVLEMH